jgi:inner membrane transporter RhtA
MSHARRMDSGFAPIAALLVAMVSVQTGAALVQTLFPLIGPQGAIALRVSIAAALLLAVRRPRLAGLSGKALRAILAYGVALGGMNILFYLAIARIPLGVAVTLEFAGPLLLSVLSHRRWTDLVWLALAAFGLLLLAPIQGKLSGLDPAGMGLALAAGGCWALYIIAGKRAGAAVAGATTAGMVVAAALVFPIGLLHAGAALFQPRVLPIAALVAVLSSALPYSLEMYALGRVPRPTFGALMSLEPALATLSGFIVLGQAVTLKEGMAIACVMVASAGAAIAYLKTDRTDGKSASDAIDMAQAGIAGAPAIDGESPG